MKDFEEAIKPFYTKVVDKDNNKVVTYVSNADMTSKRTNLLMKPNDSRKKKAKSIPPGVLPPNCSKVSNNKCGDIKKVMTPKGVFPSISEAAKAYETSTAYVFFHLRHWTDMHFYYYYGEDTQPTLSRDRYLKIKADKEIE